MSKITFNELIEEPERIHQLSPLEAEKMLIQLTSIQGLLILRALRANNNNGEPDYLIAVEDAAAILGHGKTWIYDHARELPFVVRDGKSLRCSHKGVQDYMRRKLQDHREDAR